MKIKNPAGFKSSTGLHKNLTVDPKEKEKFANYG
jgi:hypothetical protein